MSKSPEEQPDFFAPPPGPPPLLNHHQLIQLGRQGFLFLPLSDKFTADILHLFEGMQSFYTQSLDVKKSLYPEKLGTEFGFYYVEGEKEYVTLRCKSASEGDIELEKLAAKVWSQAGMMLYRILCDIARFSDLPCSIWDQFVDGTLTLPSNEADMSGTLLRMFKYLPDQGVAEKHTDLGLLTLCVGTRPGLQCLHCDQAEPAWVDADQPVVLVGQTLSALSYGTFRPGMHRVVPNTEGRFSVVYALRHSYRHQLDLERFGGEGTIDPKQLWHMIKDGMVNINAKKELREKMRQDLVHKRREDTLGQG